MKVVLDCNIIVMSLASRSPYHKIYRALTGQHIDLLVSNDILLEYEEIITSKFSKKAWELLLQLLSELKNVHLQSIYYHWNLITADKDDNKYVDCYIAGSGDFIVTQDKHFNILNNLSFPNKCYFNR